MKKENDTKRKKTKNKKSKKGFITFLVCAFVICIVFNILMSSEGRLETMIVRTGTQEESIKTEGYVFKDQTVINAPGSGYLYCKVAEDERVKIGETIAYIYKNEIDPVAESELKAVEEKIEKLSETYFSEDIFSQDTVKIEQRIAQELKKIPALGYENQMEDVAKVREDVDALIEGRRIITGETEARDKKAELESLRKRKEELETMHGIERTAVHAPNAGAFTARVDGLEDMLGMDALQEIMPSYIKELNKKNAEVKNLKKVEEGKPLGKIVNNFGWNVAVLVSADVVEDMDEGDVVDLRFTDIDVKTVKGTVTRVSPEENGKVVLTLKSNKYVDSIYSLSKVNVEIVKHHYEGFKLPSESIRVVDGKTGVFVVRNDKAQFIPVEIKYNSKEWVIAAESIPENSTIRLYDELIVNGKNLYDDKVVR